MKDNKNLEACDYIQFVNTTITINSDILDYYGIKNIVLNDNIEQLHIKHKGKEYVFDLEKALSLLCKEIEK